MPDFSVTDIVEALGKLSAEQRTEIVSKISASAAPKGKLMTFSESLLAAANNPTRLSGLHLLRSMLARNAIKFDESKKCCLADLNQQMRAQAVPADERWQIKSLLFLNGLCEA